MEVAVLQEGQRYHMLRFNNYTGGRNYKKTKCGQKVVDQDEIIPEDRAEKRSRLDPCKGCFGKYKAGEKASSDQSSLEEIA